MWRAGDVEKSCRKVLASYDVVHAPSRVAGDILSRIGAEALGKLKGTLRKTTGTGVIFLTISF